MNTRSQSRHTIVREQQKITPSADADIKIGVDAVITALCLTNNVPKRDNIHVPDAEASGRIIVREWDAIGQQGVFVGSTPIAAGEVLGALEGLVNMLFGDVA